MSETFWFGIPLIARAVASDWARITHLFGLTLRSVLAQTDADVRILLAAHEAPAPWIAQAGDPRLTFLAADWPPAPPTAANDDGGMKKWRIKQHVRAAGGGLLMFLDADDWVSRDLVRTARSGIGPADIGALIADGYALDHASGRVARFPIPGVEGFAFADLCGSSTIGRVLPDSPDPVDHDPHLALGSHHEWAQSAMRLGRTLARLDVPGLYMVGTGQNHSEHDGPFADWRRSVTQAVQAAGTPLTPALAAQFGIDPTDLIASKRVS